MFQGVIAPDLSGCRFAEQSSKLERPGAACVRLKRDHDTCGFAEAHCLGLVEAMPKTACPTGHKTQNVTISEQVGMHKGDVYNAIYIE